MSFKCLSLTARPRDALCSSLYDVYDDHLRLAAARKRDASAGATFCNGKSLLSSCELRAQGNYLSRFHKRVQAGVPCSWEDFVAHTGDCPTGERSGWCTWSLASNKLPTLRRSSGLYWAFAAERHISIRELYTAMGFPALDFLWQRPWMSRPLPFECFPADFSWTDAKRALGNAQHVGCVGSFMGVLLLTSARIQRQQPFLPY